MRLFIAVNLDEISGEQVVLAQNQLRKIADQGNFTRKGNFHFTLVFLGEVEPEKLPYIRETMETVTAAPFELTFSESGRFRRQEGDIWWLGIKANSVLSGIASQLRDGLRKKGFALEDRPFTPHLTIAREVIINEKASLSLGEFSFPVTKISLMKSERLQGTLRYTAIYEKLLP